MTIVGAASVTFLAVGNSTLQLAARPDMRGRVMSLWAVAFLGTTPIGGPIAGYVVGERRRPRGPADGRRRLHRRRRRGAGILSQRGRARSVASASAPGLSVTNARRPVIS